MQHESRTLTHPLNIPRIRPVSYPLGMYRIARRLYVQTLPTGTASYVYRYSYKGRVRCMGLGSTKRVPIAYAQIYALIAEGQLERGIDPIEHRRGLMK